MKWIEKFIKILILPVVDWAERTATKIAISAKGCPLIAVPTVMLFWLMVFIATCSSQQLIFGEKYSQSWLDVFVLACFIIYAGLVIDKCCLVRVGAINVKVS